MAIVSRHGKPDFFLTFTTNPMWREIQENLLEGQTAADRPDLVNRVFQCKLRRLINDIYKNGVLGNFNCVIYSIAFNFILLGYCIAYVGVVEFQKRGLPHCHLLITMATGSKPLSADDLDRVCQAEIPDPNGDEEEQAHYRLLSEFMLHQKCGDANPDAPCMKARRSQPQPVQSELLVQNDPQEDVNYVEDIADDEYDQPIEEFLANNLNVQLEEEAPIDAASDRYDFPYLILHQLR